jgi:septum formation protein
MKPLIILASASPRRSQILLECGIVHKIVPSNAEEIMDPAKGPARNALFNACLKAKAVAGKIKQGYVIGADTVVLSGKKLIGKPRNRAEAKRLLKEFSGKTIGVYTGLCVIDALAQKSACATAVSMVRVKKITPKMAERFIRVAGPFDKAGGFSIEGPGSFIFDNIRGSFYNVLGLPMMELYRLFGKLGIDLLEHCKA